MVDFIDEWKIRTPIGRDPRETVAVADPKRDKRNINAMEGENRAVQAPGGLRYRSIPAVGGNGNRKGCDAALSFKVLANGCRVSVL
jgi:hypothetical protein